MKSLSEYIFEGNGLTLSIELKSPDEAYNLLNALYCEYLQFKHDNKKDWMKQYEATYDKVCKAIKNAGIELDPAYDNKLSKINL